MLLKFIAYGIEKNIKWLSYDSGIKNYACDSAMFHATCKAIECRN